MRSGTQLQRDGLCCGVRGADPQLRAELKPSVSKHLSRRYGSDHGVAPSLGRVDDDEAAPRWLAEAVFGRGDVSDRSMGYTEAVHQPSWRSVLAVYERTGAPVRACCQPLVPLSSPCPQSRFVDRSHTSRQRRPSPAHSLHCLPCPRSCAWPYCPAKVCSPWLICVAVQSPPITTQRRCGVRRLRGL